MGRSFIRRKSLYLLLIPLLAFVATGCGPHNDGKDPGSATEFQITPTQAPVIVIDDTTKPEETAGKGEEEEEEAETFEEDNTEPVSFYAEEISDEIFARMQGRSFPEGCTTKREDLRYLHLLYKDIEGNTCEGEMVCNKEIADTLIDIFRQLYEASYPIEKIRLIDDYDGDDDASMADNNTSCFNYRIVSDTDHLSNHAYGLAVDLNPLYNPYIRQKDGKQIVEPPGGEPYADRSLDFDYKIDKDDLAYKLFTKAGFKWGGEWKSVKDYQHFEKR